MGDTAGLAHGERLIVPAVEALGSTPRAILAVALLLAAAWSVGGWFLSAHSRHDGRARRTALGIAVGLNMISFLGITLGQLRGLSGNRPAWLLAGLLIPGLIRLRRAIFPGEAARPSAAEERRPSAPVSVAAPMRWGRRSMWIAASLLLLLTLGPALAFPAGWDELVYHMTLPRRWLASGEPAVYADLPYSAFPSLAETLFWLMGPIDSLIAPRLLSWSATLLAIGLLADLLRRTLPSAAALGLTFAFALSPAVLLVSANCYVESFQLLNLAAWFSLALAPAETPPAFRRSRRDAIAQGVLIGGAAAVKLNGLVWLALPILAAVFRPRPSEIASRPEGLATPIRSQGMPLLLTLIVAVVVCAPFYVRPWLATGNPFSPYFAEWFSSDPARLETSRYHHAIAGAFGVRSAATFLAAPVLLAWNDRLYDGSFGWQGLFVLGLAGVAVLARRRSSAGNAAPPILAVAIVLYGAWYATAQQARFLVPAALATTLLAGQGWSLLGTRLQIWTVPLLVGASLVSLPWKTAGYYLGSWETLAGRWTWSEYVDDGTDYRYVPLVQAVAERTPPEARLLLLFEHRGLYLPRPAVIGTPFFQEGDILSGHSGSPDELREGLVREGFTHLVLARSPIGPDRALDWWERTEPVLRTIELAMANGTLRTVWESESHLILERR